MLAQGPGSAVPISERAPAPDSGSLAAAPPALESGPPERIWGEYFSSNRPSQAAVRALVQKLHDAGEHEHAIQAIQAALIHGQSQPWMYEVLALSMEIAERPREDVQRVVMSLTDFGNADFTSMMYSAAYLTRFDREAAALRMYRQASRMAEERPEPYILALRLARKAQQKEDIIWAANGVLRYGWTKDHEQIQRDAENALLELIRDHQQPGDAQEALRISTVMQEAQRRDLSARLTWSGAGDLDMFIEEPAGSVCSFEMPDSPGGGVYLHDGYGPEAENCYEQYVCPEGLSGEYRIRVKLAWGKIVGNRAQLTIITHQGTPDEQTSTQTVLLDGGEAVVRVTLDGGRRQKPRTVETTQIEARLPEIAARAQQGLRQGLSPQAQAARDRFLESRMRTTLAEQQRRPGGALTGAVGFQPIIQFVPDGAQLRTGAIVSPDRRYVRIGVNPTFTNLTDVFTFSFINGTNIGAGAAGN